MLEPAVKAVHAQLEALAGGTRAQARELVEPLLEQLAALPLVPPNRQATYLRRIEAQLRAGLERLRIRGKRLGRAALARILTNTLAALVTAI